MTQTDERRSVPLWARPSLPATPRKWLTRTLMVQGVYYLTTGAWPFVNLPSFTSVVGPEPDIFQLLVTSALIAVIGIVLAAAAGNPDATAVRLSVASALTFLAVEGLFIGRLRPVFGVDAALELCFLVAVLLFARGSPRPHRSRGHVGQPLPVPGRWSRWRART